MNKSESHHSPTITSYGAVGGLVTGSCHIYESRDSRINVDFGLFQGKLEERDQNDKSRNLQDIGPMVRGSSEILLTHTHIDHIGRLPLVFKAGFRPTVYADKRTVKFMEPMLMDSAKIQMRNDRKNPLYDYDDVEETLRHVKGVEPFCRIPVGQKHSKITAEFLPNGHVMGACAILLRDKGENTLFTGDIGKSDQLLCGGYDDFCNQYPEDPIHNLVVESTCFRNEPINFEMRKREIINGINQAFGGGGSVLIPVLSFSRSQEIREIIHNAMRSGEIINDALVVIDAPLGEKITKVFREDLGDYLTLRYGDNDHFYKTKKESLSRFDFENMLVVGSHQESIETDKMISRRKKVIIIASGGMLENGRSVNYFKGLFCQNTRNHILLTCHQVEGTKGAKLLSNPESVEEIKAKVVALKGNSSHATGPEEIKGFIDKFNIRGAKTVLIGHGNEQSRKSFAADLEFGKLLEAEIILPRIGQAIAI